MSGVSRRADFEYLKELGRGSYGTVCKVRRRSDQKICAMKKVDTAQFRTQKQCLQALQEATIMKQMRCPYIVQYFDAFEEAGCLHLVLQFCDRGDLKTYLKSAKALPERHIWRIFLRVALGLEYLHSRRVLHRDLKSENIFLVGSDDGVRIGDLGLAKMLTNTQEGATTLVGTPRYLSPEQCRGLSNYNDKCDVWALGIVLYEICSDKHRGPWDAAKRLDQLVELIKDQRPAVLPSRCDGCLQGMCDKLLNKDCVERPSISAVLATPDVAENAKKYDVWEVCEKSGLKGISPENSSANLKTRHIHKGGSEPILLDLPRCGSGGSAQNSAEVPDGYLSRFLASLGLARGETEQGPRFHRLAYCEICLAQGEDSCGFSTRRRRHHCRSCGRTVCRRHSANRSLLPHYGHGTRSPQRVCEFCSLLPAGCSSTDARLAVVAVGTRSFIWDCSSLPAASWSIEETRWAGIVTKGSQADDLCVLPLQSGAPFQVRSLSRSGSVLGQIAVPELEPDAANHMKDRIQEGGADIESVSQTPASGNVLFDKSIVGSTISAVTCSGQWASILTRDRSGALVIVIDLYTGKCLGYCRASGQDISAIAVHDGQDGFLVTGSQEGVVRIWAVPNSPELCELQCVLKGHTEPVSSISIGCNANFICTGSQDTTVRLWRRQRGTLTFSANDPAVCEDYRATGDASLSCDGSFVVYVQARLGSWENSACLWDLTSGRWERSFCKRGHSVNCVALRGAILATSGKASTQIACNIQLWHVESGTALSTIVNPGPVSALFLATLLGDDREAATRSSAGS